MRFCIVYPYGTWLMGEPCGGAEKQVGLLAQHLVHRGNEVTFVALYYPTHDLDAEGVRVRSAWEAEKGVRMLRAATHRIPSLKRLLAGVDADLYYVRGAQPVSRWVISAAHNRGAPALLGLASDRNLMPAAGRTVVPPGDGALGAATGFIAWQLLLRPALYAADAVIAQNEEQAAHCSRLGLRHVLLPSIVELPAPEMLDRPIDHDVLWAGNVHNRARRGKGIDVLRYLVEAMPGVRFAVAGALTETAFASDFAWLRSSPNVRVFERLSFSKTQELIAGSQLVLNTSDAEGFSNVMLEGWALGKPCVTLTVNPSELLARGHWPWLDAPEAPQSAGRFAGRLGACAEGDPASLSKLIAAGLGDDRARLEAGRRCRAYVAETHGADAICSRYEDLAAMPRYTSRDAVPT